MPNLYNLQVKGRFTVAQPMDTCSILCVCHIATIFCNYNVSSDALTPFHLSPMPFFHFSYRSHSHKSFQEGWDVEVHKDWNKQALSKYEKKGSD